MPARGHDHWVRSAMFSPDGAHIVTASLDWRVRIWDVADGRQLFLYDRSHIDEHDDHYFACYDPNGTRILTAIGPCFHILSAPVLRFK